MGQRLTIKSFIDPLRREDEEVFEKHGDLEEYFAFNAADDSPSSFAVVEGATSAVSAGRSCSPTNTYRTEVINNLFDAIWPDVVESLDPLIRRVIRLAASMPAASTLKETHREIYEDRFDNSDEDRGISAW